MGETEIETHGIKPGERIDDLEWKGFRIIQNPSFFCFGMDAVLLSNFVRGQKTKTLMDLGTGTGVIPLLCAAKDKASFCTGLELQPEVGEMASRSVKLNHAEDRVRMIYGEAGDIRRIRQNFPAASADIVTSNPPYIAGGRGLANPDSTRNISRHEVTVTLEDVISAAAYLLRTGGSFYLIHKPFRIAEIINCMKKYHLEPKRLQFVQPHREDAPNMVLVEGIRDAGQGCTVLPALVVYGEDGKYTDTVLRLYGKL